MDLLRLGNRFVPDEIDEDSSDSPAMQIADTSPSRRSSVAIYATCIDNSVCI